MAKIGTLGKIVFSVSDKKVHTFNELSIDTSAKYHAHDRHMNKPLLEFKGLENDKLSLSVHYSAFLGVNPENQIKRIDRYVNNGTILTLVIGGKRYGTKWVITKHSKQYKTFDNKGNLLIVESKLTLEEYVKR